jgi:hypothetical protein
MLQNELLPYSAQCVRAWRLQTIRAVRTIPRPLTAAEYLSEAKGWYKEEFARGGAAVEALAAELCEFHQRLQEESAIRDHERSFTRLRTALGQLCAMAALVAYYQSQASQEAQAAMVVAWETMRAARSGGAASSTT